MIVDAKYNPSPSLFWANPSHCSPFWKGVVWVAHAAKVGYRWQVGNGSKVLFWEDIWLGHCSLVILYWDLYVIVDEHHCTIAEAWDGVNLRLTFRRCVSPALPNHWVEVVQLISYIVLGDADDHPIWMFHPSGEY
jgi:hypothetical protein